MGPEASSEDVGFDIVKPPFDVQEQCGDLVSAGLHGADIVGEQECGIVDWEAQDGVELLRLMRPLLVSWS